MRLIAMLVTAGLLSYIPSTAQLFDHSYLSKYHPGHYYSKNGQKTEGLIQFFYGPGFFNKKEFGDCYIRYKKTKEDKSQKLTTADVTSFVVSSDSFAIIKNLDYNTFVYYQQDFAQVIEDGRIKLYIYYAVASNHSSNGMGTSRTVRSWLIEKDGILVKLTKARFKNLMPDLLKDRPVVAEKVTKKQQGYRYKDITEIVREYNLESKKSTL